jgi:hypothetical protein
VILDVMASTEPAHDQRFRVIVVVSLHLETAADLAGTTNETAVTDCIARGGMSGIFDRISPMPVLEGFQLLLT